MAKAPVNPLVKHSRRLRRKAVVGAFRLAAALDSRAHALRLVRKRVEVLRDIAYGEHRFQQLDIYRPLFAPRPLPVMLYIHGGAFTLGSKETHRGIALANAAGAQCLVVMIDYRLAPRFRFPAAHEDACLAYRWTLDHVERYGGDPNRIVVAGESAGGNLALAVAIAACYPRPEPWAQAVFERGVVPVAVQPIMPYLQVSNPARHGINPVAGWFTVSVAHDIARAYLGHEFTGAAAETLMADPIRVLEECGAPLRRFPLVFSGVGTADVCSEDVRRLEMACKRFGVFATAHFYDREAHAFHVMRWRENARRFWLDNFEFLRKALSSDLH
jgi:acetyl esterase